VEQVHLCEIDGLVIEKSKEYFPQFAHVFEDPRVKVIVADGIKYLRDLNQPTFDVVIVDSSDPIGPASVLFERDFYEVVQKVLTEEGIVCSQSECQWLHTKLIREMVNFSRELYRTVEYAYTTIPSYPCGQIGFLVCSKGGSSKVPRKKVQDAFEQKDQDSLRYYHEELHSSSFVLPKFAQVIYEPLPKQ
jgi:spermidine synthase